MTQPTIEETIEAIDIALITKGGLGGEFLHVARAALTAQSANTLPLDEIPDGWELGFISHGKFGDGATFSAQIRRIVLHTLRYAYGRTPAEALRAAIAKVKP